MEEAEVELSAEGGEQVAEFFTAIYKRLRSLATGEEEKSVRPGTFEVYRDAKEEYRFRLKASNAASEGYHSLDACLNGVESVRNSSKEAKVKQL